MPLLFRYSVAGADLEMLIALKGNSAFSATPRLVSKAKDAILNKLLKSIPDFAALHSFRLLTLYSTIG
jgi:hypothetical protein